VQTIKKSIISPKTPVRLDISNPPSRISETLVGHVRPSGQTCLASQPFLELTKYILLVGWIPEAFHGDVRLQPGHVRPNPIPQQLSPEPDISGPQVSF
jgi:hypothetical protein